MIAKVEVIAALEQIYIDMEDFCCIPYDHMPLSDADKLDVAEALNPVVSGVLALAWKHGLSEVESIDLYGAIVRDGHLTRIDLIRQMLRASSTRRSDLVDKLRRLADQLEIEINQKKEEEWLVDMEISLAKEDSEEIY